MKNWILGALISSALTASVSQSSLSVSKIQKGNWNLAGSAGGGYSTGGIGFNANLDISTMHYVADRIALGMDTSLYYATGYNQIFGYVGPSVQYNFYNNDLLTTYVKLSYLTDITRPLEKNLFRGDLGADFWLGKNFSLGPYLRTTYAFDHYTPFMHTTLGGKLGINF